MSWVYGLYIPGSTIIHRIDARVKTIWVAFYFLVIAFFNDPTVSIPIFLSIYLFAILGRVPIKRLLVVFVFFASSTIVSFASWIPYYGNVGQPIGTLPFVGWPYTRYGILYAINVPFRIFTPVSAIAVYFSTTKPYDMFQALMKFKLPYKAAAIESIALRFMPVMYKEAIEIQEAQMSRGLELQKGNIFKRIRGYVPIFIPLMVRMLKMNIELAMSLEARCFGSKKIRTFLYELRMKWPDRIMLAGIIFTFAGLAILRYGYGFGTLNP